MSFERSMINTNAEVHCVHDREASLLKSKGLRPMKAFRPINELTNSGDRKTSTKAKEDSLKAEQEINKEIKVKDAGSEMVSDLSSLLESSFNLKESKIDSLMREEKIEATAKSGDTKDDVWQSALTHTSLKDGFPKKETDITKEMGDQPPKLWERAVQRARSIGRPTRGKDQVQQVKREESPAVQCHPHPLRRAMDGIRRALSKNRKNVKSDSDMF